MKPIKVTPATKVQSSTSAPLFEKENFMWMIGGAVIMIIGFLLMGGGASKDPNIFDPKEVYSTTRITIAPIVILAGLVVELFAIFRTPKNKSIQ